MIQPQDRIQESWEDDQEAHEEARLEPIRARLEEDENFTPGDILTIFGIAVGICAILYALEWITELGQRLWGLL